MCGRRAPEPEPAAVEPLIVEEIRPEPAGGGRGLVLGGVLLVGLAVAAVLVWLPGRDRPADNPPPGNPAEVATGLQPAPAPEMVAAAPSAPERVADTAPAPRPVVAPSPSVKPESAPAPRPPVVPRPVPPAAPPVIARGPAPAPPPRPAPRVVDGVAVIAVDRPDGDYVLDRIAGGRKVKLVGKAKRLVVGGLDGGAALDASGLAAQEVRFTGPIDGGSAVTVRAAGPGGVQFQGGVDGGSKVTVEASYVGFVNPSSDVTANRGTRIGGGSRVTITAKSVYFGVIDGPDTRVEATLRANRTTPGGLRFDAVDGTAQLRYRTEDRTNPPVYVMPGRVGAGAVFKREQ